MEVPRHWRLKLYNGIKGEECGNCGHIEMVRKRPVCSECGLLFEHKGLKISGKNRIASIHKVIGKEMGVYLIHELQVNEKPTQVDLVVRNINQVVEVGL